MIDSLRLKIKDSIWIIPAFYCTVSVLLALAVNYIDNNLSKYLSDKYIIIVTTKPELAKNVLTTISGSLLTMTTITFSTIMVVLTTYSSQFSPRILRNFINDKKTMRILGIFMSGFLYSIISLLFMRNIDADANVISGTVSVIIACICIVFFAYFIQFVSQSVQVETLLDNLVSYTNSLIDEESDFIKDEHISVMDIYPVIERVHQIQEVKSNHTGYIQLIDYKKLFETAKNNNLVIEINHKIGEYVYDESKLLNVFLLENDQEVDCNIEDYITFSSERRELHDLQYSINKIVDIAIKALSPGINDPNTAIACINDLSKILIHYFKLDGDYALIKDSNNIGRLIYSRISKEKMLKIAFVQIIHYGREDVFVIGAVNNALNAIERNTFISAETIYEFKNEYL